jgi:type IV pilus assembly protein PilM
MFGLFGGGGSKNGIGVEITSERVNVVQLRRKGQNGYKLVAYGSADIPEGIVEDGRINDPATLGQVISGLLEQKKIKVKQAATAVPGKETVSRLIRLPAELPEVELRDMVLNQEASLYLPFPREDADVDYQKLGTSLDDDGIERQEILMVATPREITDTYLQSLENANLKLDVLEISSFSVIRALKGRLRDYNSTAESVAIVDIEYEFTEITITADGIPQFSRTFPIGTLQIQNAQLRAMNMPPRRSTDTEMLGAMSVPMQSMDTAGFVGGASGNAGDAAISRVLSDLSDELRRSVDFFISQTTGAEIAHIFLTGPGACIGQLDEFLRQRLGVEASVVDPLEMMAVSTEKELPLSERVALTVALGLGLREV